MKQQKVKNILNNLFEGDWDDNNFNVKEQKELLKEYCKSTVDFLITDNYIQVLTGYTKDENGNFVGSGTVIKVLN